MVAQTLDSTLRRALDALGSADLLFEGAGLFVEKDRPIEAVIILAHDEDQRQAVQVLAAAGIKAE